ncbi:TlpA family protein disulfide reductase [Actinospica robiniae]|uniref:TlpA family protein disulfide reductase n=1 Tax=Actinospica robiniae TaxID=304901 RepID=UPI0004146EE8|nr:TlpA disulfide reductase family protein [Actinospica robiniae]
MVASNPGRRAGALALSLSAAAALLAGCSGSGSSDGGNIGYVNVATGITQIKAADRQAAPKLAGSTLDGAAYTTSYSGHVTVINVWGSWCTPCREEAASLAETYQKYEGKGVQFLGINTRDDNAAALTYQAHFDIGYPSLQDPNETLVLDLKQIIPATSVPATVIVDANGKVAVRCLGSITEPELAKELDYVLGS